ncbi:hypothetical protein [Methylobacterium aquaticum]|uniref:hypothetical protein n=1 Tax=Methylobacterium aquaticum TaxID=270351 RepID=UPI00193225A3|nr:hypothetical protein [Methylobacterium aquaticum]QRE75208.1 hypothetical protein F1D61_17850 [Methylobacterium aquaticum]
MRIALVTPAWSFENSICPGCRSPHRPLQIGACKVPLERVHAHHLGPFDRFGDIQDERPASLRELEAACCPA